MRAVIWLPATAMICLCGALIIWADAISEWHRLATARDVVVERRLPPDAIGATGTCSDGTVSWPMRIEGRRASCHTADRPKGPSY